MIRASVGRTSFATSVLIVDDKKASAIAVIDDTGPTRLRDRFRLYQYEQHQTYLIVIGQTLSDTASVQNVITPHRLIADRLYNNNNNNNNIQDNVYGAVIMAEPLREFTRFI